MFYKGEKFWLFVSHSDEQFCTEIKNRSFNNDWIHLDVNGVLTIKGKSCPGDAAGFAWDGCSPKFPLFDIVFGVPDGIPDPKTEKPKTYFASMVHDALYQFGDEAKITRKEIDLLFLKMLGDFKFRYFYYVVIRVLGIFFFNRK